MKAIENGNKYRIRNKSFDFYSCFFRFAVFFEDLDSVEITVFRDAVTIMGRFRMVHPVKMIDAFCGGGQFL